MNHWALVAWDSKRHNGKDVFFIAQFGNGDLIPKINVRQLTYEAAEQPFQGKVVLSVEDVVKTISNCTLKTWIEEPEDDKHFYICDKDKDVSSHFRNPKNIPWRRISPMTLKQLNEQIYLMQCSGKEYHFLNNNCQHFAREIYYKLISSSEHETSTSENETSSSEDNTSSSEDYNSSSEDKTETSSSDY